MNWSPASVAELIRTECKAYVGEKAGRLSISGTDALVKPGAFTTLALIIHELMTNCSKYGALSDERGSVSVSMARDEMGALCIDWIERDGPEVVPPERRGFGSSIIEHSIPHELAGEAEIVYHPTGVVARFKIPERHIATFTSLTEQVPAGPTTNAVASMNLSLSGDVLVVEDNMIIAMEAEHILLSLGAAQCHVAGRVAAALDYVSTTQFTFALLDVNLGDEDSEPVAEVLKQRGVPFVVASGYGGNDVKLAALSSAPSVTKPYTKAQLAEAIARAQIA